MQIIFFDSSFNVRSGRLAVFVVIIRCSQSQRSLYLFLWITIPFVQFSLLHFVSGGSTPLLIAHQTANTFSVFLCRWTYSVLANFFQPARRCCTVSFCCRHNRHWSLSLITFPCNCFDHLFLHAEHSCSLSGICIAFQQSIVVFCMVSGYFALHILLVQPLHFISLQPLLQFRL